MAVQNLKLIEIINLSVDFFKKKNIDSPRLNIELILTKFLNCKRIELYTAFDKPLTEEELSSVRLAVKRRGNNEPLQYILGEIQFGDNIFEVNQNVLIPRPETEHLASLIIEEWQNTTNLNVLDIGTGSGCLAITLTDKLNCNIVSAVDISIDSLKTAMENSGRCNCKIDFEKIDILNEIPKGKFDIIVSNPPYISLEEYSILPMDVSKFEPRIALCDENDGLNFYRRFELIFEDLLSENGKFYLEYAYNQAEEIKKIFDEKYNVELIKDFNGIYRFCKGQKR